jgi:hypothetical protein
MFPGKINNSHMARFNSASTKIVLAFVVSLSLLQVNARSVERVLVRGGRFSYQGTRVFVKSFEISKHEITNERYAAFLNSKQVGIEGKLRGILLINIASKELQIEMVQKRWVARKGYEQHPMVMVNYDGALEFCKWMGGSLPTETQWVYAATAGGKELRSRYAGGNILEEVGWYKNNSNGQAHPVGQKKPNQLGIYDMSGNAWEWCLNESFTSSNDSCIHMGGSWYAGEQPCRLASRYGNTSAHFSNSVGFRVVFAPDSFVTNRNFFKRYNGKPWAGHPRQLPGKLQCEWYDLGGEGIAYHDTDSINNGSGKLNPPNGTLLNQFRMQEGVDISYTKSRQIDNNPFNLVEPMMDELYTGWTMPGEWINYSIDVTSTGAYTVGLMYTASGDGEIALFLDGEELTAPLLIPSTRNEKETIDWRNWHHWNKIDSLVTLHLPKGKHVLTLKTISQGNMNYDYLDFKLNK